MGNRSKADSTAMDRALRNREILAMRRQGQSEEMIAAQVGISRQAVHKVIHKLIAKTPEREAKALREIAHQRFERLFRVLDPAVEMGDVEACKEYRQTIVAHAEVTGFKLKEPTGPAVSVNIIEATPSEARRLIKEKFAQDQDAGPDEGSPGTGDAEAVPSAT